MGRADLQRSVASVAASGFAFAATCAMSQCVQLHALRVHTGHRFAPTVLGAATVMAASVASVQVGDAVADGDVGPPSPAAAIFGVATFVALGGRFWRLSPSSLANLGALADTARGSLPATLAYATRAEREMIQTLGRRFGCHSCGARPLLRGAGSLSFIADHQPPLASVRVANAALWRRLLGWRVQQRFYPQCGACSSKQAALLSERAALTRRLGSVRKALAVRGTAPAAVLHWPSPLRPQYAVGAVLAALSRVAPEPRKEADAAVSAAVVRWRAQWRERERSREGAGEAS